MPGQPDPSHFSTILQKLKMGKVVPFLGAGINMCARPDQGVYRPGCRDFLPNGNELAEHLASLLNSYKEGDELKLSNLLQVAQDYEIVEGLGPLYEELRTIFNADYPITPLHDFFAKLPQELRNCGSPNPYQLIVTTNYDKVLEQAFERAGEPYDMVCYMTEGSGDRVGGRFVHYPHGEKPRQIDKPDEYTSFDFDKRSIILKIHGTVDRLDPNNDSYVITEDNYINYLAHSDTSGLIPKRLLAQMKNKHFLFLGYGLRDWNLRVLLYQLWNNRKASASSWAIQKSARDLDEKFWVRHNVEVFDIDLKTYIERLQQGVLLAAAARAPDPAPVNVAAPVGSPMTVGGVA